MSKELKTYIEQALGKGCSKDEIKTTLVSSGWSGNVVERILGQYVGVDTYYLPIPAPGMSSHQIARDLFLYLLALITLSLSAFALGCLFFTVIDKIWPAVVSTQDNYFMPGLDNGVSFAMAQIIITFPVFSWVSFLISKDIQNHSEKRESLIRKLMIYLTLVISAVVSIGDLISLVFNLLQGDLTSRFLAKSFVILLIAFLIFIYYLWEVRRDDQLLRNSAKQ